MFSSLKAQAQSTTKTRPEFSHCVFDWLGKHRAFIFRCCELSHDGINNLLISLIIKFFSLEVKAFDVDSSLLLINDVKRQEESSNLVNSK